MKSLTKAIAIAACAIITLPVSANVGGESEDNALMTTKNLKDEVFTRVQDIKGEYYNLKDATVKVSFFINPTGDVAVENVEGDNHLANAKVARLLLDQKMYVAAELQNTRHTVTIRYIRD